MVKRRVQPTRRRLLGVEQYQTDADAHRRRPRMREITARMTAAKDYLIDAAFIDVGH
jgi:hypothetical protein